LKITLTILLAAMALPCMAMTEIPGQAGNDGRGQAWNDGTVKVTDVYGFAVNIAKARVFNQKLKRK